jgi:hypothetical protein
MLDYNDHPLHQSRLLVREKALLDSKHRDPNLVAKYDCIHGHYLPVKYQHLANTHNAKFITWLRDPVERVLSHYYYWKQNKNPPVNMKLHHLMLHENWDIQRFCLGPELQNIYTQFLYKFPISRFDFIGITEFYDEDHQEFMQRFSNKKAKPLRLNIGRKEGTKYDIDTNFRDQIMKHHAEDIALYHTALDLRSARGAKNSHY